MGASRPQHTTAYRGLCRLLKKQREDAGLTQRALAKRLGVVQAYVWKCKVGERRIDPVEFVKWCRACGVDPADAITRVA